MDSVAKRLDDEYKIVLLVEMYKGYRAHSNSSLRLEKSSSVRQVDKSITLCYKPVIDKEFDFVINPGILESVI